VLVTVPPRGEQHFAFLLDITVGSRTSFREYNAAARLVVPVQFVRYFLWDMSVDAGEILERRKEVARHKGPSPGRERRERPVQRGECRATGVTARASVPARKEARAWRR
jgi:hypothetical protein